MGGREREDEGGWVLFHEERRRHGCNMNFISSSFFLWALGAIPPRTSSQLREEEKEQILRAKSWGDGLWGFRIEFAVFSLGLGRSRVVTTFEPG